MKVKKARCFRQIDEKCYFWWNVFKTILINYKNSWEHHWTEVQRSYKKSPSTTSSQKSRIPIGRVDRIVIKKVNLGSNFVIYEYSDKHVGNQREHKLYFHWIRKRKRKRQRDREKMSKFILQKREGSERQRSKSKTTCN